jgi:hypothetical protein
LTEEDKNALHNDVFREVGKKCLEILHLVNLLSRTNHNNNLRFFLQFKVVSYPIQIARLATQKLLSDEQNFLFWWEHLRVVLANCFQIIGNFTNPHFFWKQFQLHPGDMHHIPSELEELFVESKNMVIKLGFMKTLRGNIFEGVLMELS